MRRKLELSVFSRSILLTIVMFLIVFITFAYYAYTEKQIDRANEMRQRSYVLADELRQSSDDLTRMVRTYVLTSNPLYKQHFQEILDIRDGRKPRPSNYKNISWDLVPADQNRPHPNGPAIALLDLMRQAGFTEAEFAKLALAKVNSDALTETEFAAMALIESANPLTEATRLKASNMLHDAAYHHAKAEIMRPISEFYDMMDQRTKVAVRDAEQMATLVRVLFISLDLLLLITLWRAHRALHFILGCSVDQLRAHIVQIGTGDLTQSIPVNQGMEDTVLNWLAETRNNLQRISVEREHAEEELRRYKDHLEEEVKQRTADLVLARDAAEVANRSKSVFLANMSHELRTPLNAILGFSQIMARNTNIPAQELERLRIINRSGEHLLMLINDVLEMSKIEAGRVQLEIAPFDLGNLVSDVIDMMEMRTQEKGLQLLVDQASTCPRYIRGDEVRLRQILVNLLGNAVKFTQQGAVKMRLDTRPDDRTHLIIDIEDSGPGISPEDQQRLFQPFVQLGRHAADNKGTGLGLAITHQYVGMMGGTISVDSSVGRGSIFRVELPVEAALAEEISPPEQSTHREILGLVPGQPAYRTLIVEDQLDNQLLLSQLMETLDLEVKIAENGEQGMALFQSWRPHLIWMDRNMPGMDGVEATKGIRALPGGKEVKIVAVTASAMMDERTEMLNAGMDDVVCKPYRASEIYQCLKNQLGAQYIYANTSSAAEQTPIVLTTQMLAVLPSKLRDDLRTALESLVSERIDAVIAQVQSQDAVLHKKLVQLADDLDYPAILNVLQQANLP